MDIRYYQNRLYSTRDFFENLVSSDQLKPAFEHPFLTRYLPASIPLFFLYEPMRAPLGRGLTILKIATEGYELSRSREGVRSTAIRLASIAGHCFILYHSYCAPNVASFTTSVRDLSAALPQLIRAVQLGQREGAIDALQKVSGAALKLCFMTSGILELQLAILLLQALYQLYQCHQHYGERKYFETAIDTILTLNALNEARDCLELIQLRNAWLKSVKHLQIYYRLQNNKRVEHLKGHPLENLEDEGSDVLDHFKQEIELLNGPTDESSGGELSKKEVVLYDAKGVKYSFGNFFHGYGKGLVKGANLQWRKINRKGQEWRELNFTVNRWYRNKIEEALQDLKSIDSKDLQNLIKMTDASVKSLNLGNSSLTYGYGSFEQHFLQADGLGEVCIGCDDSTPTLYHRVTVRMPKEKDLYDYHQLLTIIGLESALMQSTEEDFERMKVGHLFRTFHPKEATSFERTEEFFTLPIDDLKKSVTSQCPAMEKVFDKHLASMKKMKLFKGRKRLCINGLAKQAKKLGACCLTSVITGAWSKNDVLDRAVSVMKMGLLSGEMRNFHGINASGMSNTSDLYEGSSDSVFTQLALKKDVDASYNTFAYTGPVRFLISLKAIESGTYQYPYDSYGTRLGSTYENRKGILEFVKSMASSDYSYTSNEVMVKDAIPPSLIQGVAVQNQMYKDDLIAALIGGGVIQSDQDSFNGQSIQDFIQVV